MYRFLVTPRWLGYAALTALASALMVLAGHWQYERYTQRTAANARIDAAEAAAAVPLTAVLGAPPGTGAGAPPPAAARWTRVSVSGRYDAAHEVVVRGRNLAGERGFEVLTPLRLDTGAAILVDRGWLAATTAGDARSRPALPPPAAGAVTVVGRLAPPESGAGPVDQIDGRPEVRRIAPANLATHLPYPLYGGYLLRDVDSPDPADEALTALPSPRQRTWQNAGYVVQWWLFAAMTWLGFGWLARREAQAAAADRAGTPGPGGDGPGRTPSPGGGGGPTLAEVPAGVADRDGAASTVSGPPAER